VALRLAIPLVISSFVPTTVLVPILNAVGMKISKIIPLEEVYPSGEKSNAISKVFPVLLSGATGATTIVEDGMVIAPTRVL